MILIVEFLDKDLLHLLLAGICVFLDGGLL